MSAPPDPSVSSIPLSTEFRTVSALTFCMLRTNSLRCSPGTPHVRAMRPHFALFCRDLSCLSFSPRIPCISAASFSSHGLTRTVLSNRSGRLHIRAYPSCAPREKPTRPTFLPSPPTHSSSSASASSVWNVLSVCLPNPMMCGTTMWYRSARQYCRPKANVKNAPWSITTTLSFSWPNSSQYIGACPSRRQQVCFPRRNIL